MAYACPRYTVAAIDLTVCHTFRVQANGSCNLGPSTQIELQFDEHCHDIDGTRREMDEGNHSHATGLFSLQRMQVGP